MPQGTSLTKNSMRNVVVKIDWTPEKKDRVCESIEKFLKEMDCTTGECFMQSDECIIGISGIMADIIDDVIKPEWIDDDSLISN